MEHILEKCSDLIQTINADKHYELMAQSFNSIRVILYMHFNTFDVHYATVACDYIYMITAAEHAIVNVLMLCCNYENESIKFAN